MPILLIPSSLQPEVQSSMQVMLPDKAQLYNPMLSTPFTICIPLPCIHSKRRQDKVQQQCEGMTEA